MNPARWQRLDELFHAALEREPDARATFSAEACAGDDELHRELESMLKHHEQAGTFIESPEYIVAPEPIVNGDYSGALAGKSFGPYQTLRVLGNSGMGVVYLATDTKLSRKVALKILPRELTGDQSRVQRFKQEVLAASALNHPNIITVFEIQASDGRHSMATEFVEGATLRELIAGRKMDLQGVLNASIQIASALSAAHASGIVHRDIKPENIMRRTDGHIKVLNFGLARLMEPTLR